MSAWRRNDWSYTQWALYKKCPYAANCRFNEQLRPAGKNKALLRGIDIHNAIEDFLKGVLSPTKLPRDVVQWKKRLRDYKSQRAVAEEPWAFDAMWRRASYSYKKTEAWVRMKLDAHIAAKKHMQVFDWKTGKIREEHEHQGSLFALGTLKRYPGIETVDVSFAYIDQNEVQTHEYSRDDEEFLQQLWEGRAEEMFSETSFFPRPSPLCDYCDFSKAAGGPCKYGTRDKRRG